MRLLPSLYLLSLAIAPIFATADGEAKSKSGSKNFDVKSLSLREVGARNTVVSRKLYEAMFSQEQAVNCDSGLACLAGAGWRPDFLLARHSSLP